jgi:anti-sigma factor RsiW
VTALPPDEHRFLREQLGVYALGLITPEEQAVVHAHLDGCPMCRTDLASLSAVAARLADASPLRLEDLPDPPGELREKVLARIAVEEGRERTIHRRRTRSIVARVAAGLAALAAAFVIGWLVRPAPPAAPVEAVAVEVTVAGVEVSAGVVPHTWGVEVKLSGTGFAAGQTYRAAVFAEDGTAVPAGSFIGVGPAEMNCNLNSSVLRENAAGFEVVDVFGAVVARSAF